jgi:DNA repair exonuclease SbcCD ATPase subunit
LKDHLSEEISYIDAEWRSDTQLRQEIKDLKEQLVLAKESGKELSDGAEGNEPDTERIQQLEQELDQLKRERSTTAEPRPSVFETQEFRRPNIEVFADNDGGDTPTSGSAKIHGPLTPGIEIYVDEGSDGVLLAPDSDSNGALRDVELIQASSSVKEAATQASLPDAHAETFRAARLRLEYLFPGEIALGLVPENPKPLFDIMFQRMETLKAQTLVAGDALARTQTQETNLRNQFNAVLEQLERARKYAEGTSTRTSNEKARADSNQARVQALEMSVQAATTKVSELEKNIDEKDRSISKLQDALGTYRVEVGKLEVLITQMEADHNTAMSNLQAETDEAVADLECHVAAETVGRREAEQEVEEQKERIKQLKVQEQELKTALNEKQQIIRETERIFGEERLGREREVGGLNVRIGQLSSDLSESNGKLANAEQSQQILLRKLREERDAGLRAVKAVQAEHASAVGKSEDIKTAHVSDSQRRGAEVTEHTGLLTPVSACRFKDVEGYVEVRRGKGKKRDRDSAIVIQEEDEDEDMIMADDV